MTTHDDRTSTHSESQSDAIEPSTARTDPPAAHDSPSPAATRTDSTAAHGEPPVAGDESSTARSEPSELSAEPSAEPSTAKSLFADNDLSGLRSRWDDVQAAFVDDPKECVQKADALVAKVVEQLTAGFSEARSRLEAQWARGEEASTEDLRLALKRYRDFFERLLSV